MTIFIAVRSGALVRPNCFDQQLGKKPQLTRNGIAQPGVKSQPSLGEDTKRTRARFARRLDSVSYTAPWLPSAQCVFSSSASVCCLFVRQKLPSAPLALYALRIEPDVLLPVNRAWQCGHSVLTDLRIASILSSTTGPNRIVIFAL